MFALPACHGEETLPVKVCTMHPMCCCRGQPGWAELHMTSRQVLPEFRKESADRKQISAEISSGVFGTSFWTTTISQSIRKPHFNLWLIINLNSTADESLNIFFSAVSLLLLTWKKKPTKTILTGQW